MRFVEEREPERYRARLPCTRVSDRAFTRHQNQRWRKMRRLPAYSSRMSSERLLRAVEEEREGGGGGRSAAEMRPAPPRM